MDYLERREFARNRDGTPRHEYFVACPRCHVTRWVRVNRQRLKKATGFCKSCWLTSRPANMQKYHSLFPTWKTMNYRCHNPAAKNFHIYGGRGISVCPQWRFVPVPARDGRLHPAFEQFLADMGPRPTPLHSMDRIDVNGNYEPGNCRWATKREQNHNSRGYRPRPCPHCGKDTRIPPS